MNLRWLLWDYVDPSVPIDRETRRDVRREARRVLREEREEPGARRPADRWQVLQPIIPGAVMLLPVILVMTLPRVGFLLILPLVVLQLAVTYGLMGLVAGLYLRPRVYELLRRRGHDVCLRCGYLLTGLPQSSDCCPECGRPVAGGRKTPHAS